MKKTVTINISGIIFNIDEDAYEKLKKYLMRVKSHFANSEGRDEIIGDIEGRVAELLQEKLTELKQVIIIEDIDEVIALMGEPAEFDEDDVDSSENARFSRSNSRAKRLYRDPDNKMLAGVSSGLAYYFNIDPIWFRALFIISSFSGAGIIAYLILWLVVPEAATTAEKLEMRGEPVNLSNIEASISQEFENLKGKFNDLTDEAKRSFKKKSSPTFLENILQAIATIFRIFIKIVLVIIGVFLVLVGITSVLSLLAGITGLSSFSFFEHGELVGFSLPLFLQAVFSSDYMGAMAVVSALLIVFVPLIMLIYLGLRLLIGKRMKINYIGRSALGLWLTGLILGAFVALNTSLDFRNMGMNMDEYEIQLAPDDTLYLDASLDKSFKNRQYFQLFDMKVQINGDNYLVYSTPNITFKKTNEKTPCVILKGYAKGRTGESAYERASSINYIPVVTDSSFVLPTYFTLPQNSLIRNQELEMKIEIPEGQIVHFSENMRKLFNADWRYYHRYKDYSGKTWVMSEDGLVPYKQIGKNQETDKSNENE